MEAFEFKQEKKNYFSQRILGLLVISISIVGCAKDSVTPPAPVYDYSVNPTIPTNLSPITSNAGAGVTDIDGNTYTSVVLGNGQEWTVENLKTSKYTNGDPIPNETGVISAISIKFAGKNYKDGLYNNVTLIGGAGTGATADIVIDTAGKATSVVLVNPGNGYLPNDVFSVKDSLLSDTLIGEGLFIKITAIQWQNLTSGAWSDYNFNSVFEAPYGKLYNYFVVADVRNACPTGWHVPSDADWNTLITYLDPQAVTSIVGNQSTTAGGRIKSKGIQYWASLNNYATNESGLSALPGGARDSIGDFNYITTSASFWTSTELNTNTAYSRDVSYGSGFVYRHTIHKNAGNSIRCLKD